MAFLDELSELVTDAVTGDPVDTGHALAGARNAVLSNTASPPTSFVSWY